MRQEPQPSRLNLAPRYYVYGRRIFCGFFGVVYLTGGTMFVFSPAALAGEVWATVTGTVIWALGVVAIAKLIFSRPNPPTRADE